MKRTLYRLVIVFVGMLLLFVITNPATQKFKDFKKLPSNAIIERKNYILYSIYIESGSDGIEVYRNEYIGVLGMFFVKYLSTS